MADEMGGQQPTKHQRIADDLKAAITAGDYGPGDRLPGENALAAQYNVAALTARQALKLLRTEGLIETKKGAGARVIAFHPIRRHSGLHGPPAPQGAGMSIREADEDRNTTIDVSVQKAEAPAQVAQALGLSEGEFVCIRSRRFIVDGRPVRLESSYFPLALLGGSALPVDLGEGSTHAVLSEFGHAPVHVREEVRSRQPTLQEATALGMPLERSVLKVHRIAVDKDGRAVEMSDTTLDSAAYVLSYGFDV
ncbi:GntR family transcriptional regulator (plasmid) [Streptomyces sp. DSM 116496]|uniref:GntR family transcriptional regulator n=1 Tax=Streptomyces stoeckheimensis TaxID=3344656 RepID=UPI0038B3B076